MIIKSYNFSARIYILMLIKTWQNYFRWKQQINLLTNKKRMNDYKQAENSCENDGKS